MATINSVEQILDHALVNCRSSQTGFKEYLKLRFKRVVESNLFECDKLRLCEDLTTIAINNVSQKEVGLQEQLLFQLKKLYI